MFMEVVPPSSVKILCRGGSRCPWKKYPLDPLSWEVNCAMFIKTLVNGWGIFVQINSAHGVVTNLTEGIVQNIISPVPFRWFPGSGKLGGEKRGGFQQNRRGVGATVFIWYGWGSIYGDLFPM